MTAQFLSAFLNNRWTSIVHTKGHNLCGAVIRKGDGLTPDLRYTQDVVARLSASHEQPTPDRISGRIDVNGSAII